MKALEADSPSDSASTLKIELTNEEMNKIRAIRESTCIHGCYYTDDPKECIPPEENGIPNCKREIERITAEIMADSSSSVLDRLREKAEARIKELEHNRDYDNEKRVIYKGWIAPEAHRIEELQDFITEINMMKSKAIQGEMK